MKETLHIYTRVSSVSQEEEGTSLETQLELGIERSKVSVRASTPRSFARVLHSMAAEVPSRQAL